MTPNGEFCTPAQAAEILDVTPDTIRRWARDGKIRAIVMPSGRRRFRRAEVEALLSGDSEPVSA